MGLKITVVESALHTSNHYLVVSLVKALRSHPQVSSVQLCDLCDALVSTQAALTDMLLVFGGEQAESYVIRTLRNRSRVSVVWYLEDPYEIKQNLLSRALFDIVFTNDGNSSLRYGSNSYHLPLAGESSFASKFEDFHRRPYDLSFIGTSWPNRAEVLMAVKDQLAGVKSKIIVVDNEFTRPYLESMSFDFPLSKGIDYTDYMRITQLSRVSLMIDRSFSGSGQDTVSDTPGPRFFEAGAAGACVFVDNRVVGHKLIELGFIDGQHYFGFSSSPELRELIGELSFDPKRFMDSARALQFKIACEHTYEARAERIVDIVTQFLNQRNDRLKTSLTIKSNQTIKVLAIAHNLVEFGNFGGGELYLSELASRSRELNFYTLAHDARSGFGSRYVLVGPDGALLKEFIPSSSFSDVLLTCPEVEQFFINCCELVKPDVIMVNHLIGFPPTLPLIASHLGLPYILAIHDYYLACDSYNLLTYKGTYCGVSSPTDEFCDLCTYKRRNMQADAQIRRRILFGDVLDKAFAVVANTSSSAELIQKLTGINARRVEIIPPPRVHRTALQSSSKQTITHLRRVAVLGNLSPNKGMSDLVNIAKALDGYGISFEIFGRPDGRFIEEIEANRVDCVHVHGSFEPGKLPAMLGQCEVALFLSNWPETYCMSLTEVLDIGIVPIAYDIGALGERVTDDIGFKVAPNPSLVINLVKDLIEDPRPLIDRWTHLSNRPIPQDSFVLNYEMLMRDAVNQSVPCDIDEINTVGLDALRLSWISKRWDGGDFPDGTDFNQKEASSFWRSLNNVTGAVCAFGRSIGAAALNRLR